MEQNKWKEIAKKKAERDGDIAAKTGLLEQFKDRISVIDKMLEQKEDQALKKKRRGLKMQADVLEEQLIKE